MPIPLYAMGAYIHVSSELRSCRTEPQEEELSLAGRRRRRRHEMETNRIPHPDLKLQELDVVDGLLEHGAHVHLGAIGHQALQHLEPLVDPLPPLLHHHHHPKGNFSLLFSSTEQQDCWPCCAARGDGRYGRYPVPLRRCSGAPSSSSSSRRGQLPGHSRCPWGDERRRPRTPEETRLSRCRR